MANQHQAHRGKVKAGHYQAGPARVSRNKARRAQKRARLLRERPKQPTVSVIGRASEIGVTMVNVSAILAAKQTRRKARNKQCRTNLLKAMQGVPPKVEASNAE